MSNLDDSGLDLDQLFLPAWAQKSSDINKYADYTGYPENDKFNGKDGGRRKNTPRGERAPWGKTDRNTRKDRPKRPRTEDGSLPRTGVEKSSRSERSGKYIHRGDHPRKPLLPLPEVNLQLVPESIVVETLARQIRQTARAYPLFEIAHIILKRPERLEVSFSVVKKNNQVVQPLFFCSLDRTLWFSEDDAMDHVLKNHFADFYETEEIPIEGPKGTYTFVAQCGMSGEVLGPPNLHDYQTKLCKIHAEKFSHIPFDVYKSRIRIVKDPEIIEKWKKEMSTSFQYKCLQVPEPLILQDMTSVKEHFKRTHLASVVQNVESIMLSVADIRKQPNHLISVLYRKLLEEQKRFPLKLVTTLSQKFAAHALQFFKVNKTITHVCISRPHYLDMENTSVSENVKNIMGYVTSHPGCKRADIYKALIPGYEDAISQIPENIINPTEKKEKEVIQSTETESSVENGAEEKKDAKDEPQSTSVSAPELPEEVSSNLANLNADLHWLIQCGHVIEFYKGNIEPAPKKIAPPSPKPKEKKDSAKNKKKEEKENTGKTEVQNSSSEEEMDSNASGAPVTSIEKDQVKPVIPTSEMEQPIESNTESNQSTEETSSVIPPKSEEKEN